MNNDGIDNNRPSITVSYTSFPARIDTAGLVAENMLRQTMKPDRIVLWLARSQFPDGEGSLPQTLLDLRVKGLKICWCEDSRSYKKLIPSLRAYPDDLIITVDDDLVYRDDMVELLYKSWLKFPEAVHAMRVHCMRFDAEGNICPYQKWRHEYSGMTGVPSRQLFVTTGAGTLFPPHILPDDALDSGTFMSLAPRADDMWIRIMMTLADVPAVLAYPCEMLRYIPGTQKVNLYMENQYEGGNDAQLAKLINRFAPRFGSEAALLSRMTDPRAGLAAEMTAIVRCDSGADSLVELVGALCGQTKYGVQTVCVCEESSEAVEAIAPLCENDNRVRLVTAGDVHSLDALKKAVSVSEGEYVIFLDSGDSVFEDTCARLQKKASGDGADVMLFSYMRTVNGSFEQVMPCDISRAEDISREPLAVCFGENAADASLCGVLIRGEILRRVCSLLGERPDCDADMCVLFAALDAAERVSAVCVYDTVCLAEKNADRGGGDIRASFEALDGYCKRTPNSYGRAKAMCAICAQALESELVAWLEDDLSAEGFDAIAGRFGTASSLDALMALGGGYAGLAAEALCSRCEHTPANMKAQSILLVCDEDIGDEMEKSYSGAGRSVLRITADDAVTLDGAISRSEPQLVHIAADRIPLGQLILARMKNIPVLLTLTESVMNILAGGDSAVCEIDRVCGMCGAVTAESEVDAIMLGMLGVRVEYPEADKETDWAVLADAAVSGDGCMCAVDPAVAAGMGGLLRGVRSAFESGNQALAAADTALNDAERRLSRAQSDLAVCRRNENSRRADQLEAQKKQYEKKIWEKRNEHEAELEKVRAEASECEKKLRTDYEKRLDAVLGELRDVRESTIFKAGRVVTYVPRKAKTTIEKLKNGD